MTEDTYAKFIEKFLDNSSQIYSDAGFPGFVFPEINQTSHIEFGWANREVLSKNYQRKRFTLIEGGRK